MLVFEEVEEACAAISPDFYWPADEKTFGKHIVCILANCFSPWGDPSTIFIAPYKTAQQNWGKKIPPIDEASTSNPQTVVFPETKFTASFPV